MKVLINPKFTITPTDVAYHYTIVLDKKNLNQLTIKRASKKANDKRIIGHVERDGQICIKKSYEEYFFKNVLKIISPNKIALVLDLIFGEKRDKLPTIGENGLVEFKHIKN